MIELAFTKCVPAMRTRPKTDGDIPLPKFARLFAGGRWIRTLGPRQKDNAFRYSPVQLENVKRCTLSIVKQGHPSCYDAAR